MINPNDFKYVILSGNATDHAEFIHIHNDVYALWKSVWTQVFQDLKIDSSQLANDFFRQKYIGALYYKEQVAAVHLYSRFSLKSQAAQEHSYFQQNYPREFFDKLQAMNISEILSMEYLTVSPHFHFKKLGLSLAELIMALDFRLFHNTDAMALIAPARNDFKISHKAYKHGCICLVPNVVNHNVSCDLIAGIRGQLRDSDDPELCKLVDAIWEERLQLVEIITKKLQLVA
jgi:hypothetical protein